MTNGAPNAPAGWYPVYGGGKRFWNGQAWTTDVISAPTREAECAALDPYLPAPTAPTLPLAPEPLARQDSALQPHPSTTPPGWYPSPNGAMQWWDGRAWGPLAPPQAVSVRPVKETGIAYLFWILLGGFGAHRFYLGLAGSAIALIVLWVGGWLLTPLFVGVPMVIAGGIWLFVDLFLIPGLVRSQNASQGYFR
jgi:TM2 domain-containing membrane protein YozV